MFKQIAISMLTMASLASARRLEKSGDEDEVGMPLTLKSDKDPELTITEGSHVEFQLEAPFHDELCGWFLLDASWEIVKGDRVIDMKGYEFKNSMD